MDEGAKQVLLTGGLFDGRSGFSMKVVEVVESVVGQRVVFGVSPEIFDGIEFRRVRGKIFYGQSRIPAAILTVACR